MEETGTSALLPSRTTTSTPTSGSSEPPINIMRKPAVDEIQDTLTKNPIERHDATSFRSGEEHEQSACQAGQEDHQRAWIGYCVEFKDPLTDEIIYRNTSRKPTDEGLLNIRQGNEPIFEQVTTYKARSSSDKRSPKAKSSVESDSGPPRPVGPAASHSVHIYSTAIINALQAVVAYYPSQDLSGDVLKIDWPYRVLVHHYDELVAFREQAMLKSPEDLCVRERDAPEHLKLLTQFLDDTVMVEIRAEAERNKRGSYTYEHFWYSHRPGSVLLSTLLKDDQSHWGAFVVKSVSGGPSEDSAMWLIHGWNLGFDGTYLNRQETGSSKLSFTGEGNFEAHTRFIYDRTSLDDDEAQRKIAYGKRYWELIQKQCQHYKGKSRDFPYNEVDGLVMTDMKQYYTHDSDRKPRFMDRSDLRNWTSDCTCSICKQGKGTKPWLTRKDWSTYYTRSAKNELASAEYLLCPPEIPAFVFRTRTWENLHVKNFQSARFDQHMIDSLVTKDQSRVDLLKALAKCFARENSAGKIIDKEPWSADYVRGKGNGLIFLLHGKPGVGKTYTAECIAQYTKRPLMVLTSSDIGTDPSLIESNLTSHFKTATSWGAVLLIDEADVFMERRSTADLARNSLVAGFLRALEFYEGILFLTTNRVGAFDDAFISRVHIKLYYPDFSETERQRVWDTFVKKLAKERGDYMRVTIGAQEYIREGRQLREVSWNGREIRNAFQTAVSLAEYQNQQDSEGKIMLTEAHLKSVVELSKDFKDYLDELHTGDESKRALKRKERLDDYGI